MSYWRRQNSQFNISLQPSSRGRRRVELLSPQFAAMPGAGTVVAVSVSCRRRLCLQSPFPGCRRQPPSGVRSRVIKFAVATSSLQSSHPVCSRYSECGVMVISVRSSSPVCSHRHCLFAVAVVGMPCSSSTWSQGHQFTVVMNSCLSSWTRVTRHELASHVMNSSQPSVMRHVCTLSISLM